jgi:hypothetical protein
LKNCLGNGKRMKKMSKDTEGQIPKKEKEQLSVVPF